MSILQSLNCKRGAHQWSDWKFVPAPERLLMVPETCREERQCAACQVVETRQVHPHQWSDWTYVAEPYALTATPAGGCLSRRECASCHSVQTRTEREHQWSDWGRKGDALCRPSRACRRCKQVEVAPDSHAWSDWTDNTVLRVRQRQCVRCRQTELASDRQPLYLHLGFLLFNHFDTVEIRAIGAELHRIGGTALMRQVAIGLQAQDSMLASRLNSDWDGVGGWMA